ncbi:MAG: glycosyltransferase family 4 protein [Mediterranea sp.]|jgi:glycosyltransferase involved in cell wall biosynthesis|nr:glycosyltransferase family 4 protein [Mediterranea sp.]
MKKGKLLVVMMYSGGGCFQYAKELIARLTDNPVVYMNSYQPETHNIANYYPLKTFGFSSWERIFSIVRFVLNVFISGLRGKYSGLLLFGPSPWDNYVVQAFSFCKKPVFYVVHDGEMHLGDKNDKTQNRLLNATRQADYLIFLSNQVKNQIKRLYGIHKPSLVLPHGLISYGEVPVSLRQRKEKPVLLFLGRLSRYKGIDLLLEAMEQVDNNVYKKLIIAGAPVGDYHVTVDHPQIEVREEWLTEADILAYLQEADILLFPYLEASQSGVATLAINYLLPSIATQVGAFEEQFGEAALFIEPDSTALAEAIQLLCTDTNLYQDLSEKLAILREHYSWQYLSESLTEFIKQHTAK